MSRRHSSGARVPDGLLDEIRARNPLAALIGRTVQLRRSGRCFQGLCPFHAERNPSFAVYESGYHCFGCGAHGDAFSWLQHCCGCSFQEAVNTLAQEGGMDAPFGSVGSASLPTGLPVPEVSLSHEANDEVVRRNQQFALSIWDEGQDPAGTPVEIYLGTRRLSLTDDTGYLRFHPACPRGRSERLPAMIALMIDPVTFEPCGLHRTFLRPDGSGKADGQDKMMLGRAGIICLERQAEIAGALGIAEGIETALSVQQHLRNVAMWACATAGGIERLPPHPVIQKLSIYADRDENGHGLRAARACAARWSKAGTNVEILTPREVKDWNDVIMRRAMH